jgi:hypothetical protein
VLACTMRVSPDRAIGSSWSIYFRPLAPGEEAPPPPAELALWSSQTGHAVLFGLLFGGWTGLRAAGAATSASAASEGFLNVRHRAATFTVRNGVLVGARTGSFVALLSGSALLAESLRGVSDPWNVCGAGALTCGIFGGAVGGWRAAAGTAVFGAATGGLLALGQDKLYSVAEQHGLDMSSTYAVRQKYGSPAPPQNDPENDASGMELVQSTVSWLEGSQRSRQSDHEMREPLTSPSREDAEHRKDP